MAGVAKSPRDIVTTRTYIGIVPSRQFFVRANMHFTE